MSPSVIWQGAFLFAPLYGRTFNQTAIKRKESRKMGIYEELVARGLIAQVTNEEEIREMVNNGKATFYIGFDCTADSLHVGHFMAVRTSLSTRAPRAF